MVMSIVQSTWPTAIRRPPFLLWRRVNKKGSLTISHLLSCESKKAMLGLVIIISQNTRDIYTHVQERRRVTFFWRLQDKHCNFFSLVPNCDSTCIAFTRSSIHTDYRCWNMFTLVENKYVPYPLLTHLYNYTHVCIEFWSASKHLVNRTCVPNTFLKHMDLYTGYHL